LFLALARMERDYDDVESLKWSTQARAGYAAHPDASVSQHGMSAMYVGLAHGALGQLESAESALKACLQQYDRIFGRTDRDSVSALGHLARVLAARASYDEARLMLDERLRYVEANPGADTAFAVRMLLTRQVELALMQGDLEAAGRMIEPMRTRHAQLTNEPARGPAVINEARWHQLAGRPQASATVLTAWLAKLPPERASEPLALRARLIHADAEMALGHHEPARRLLDEAMRDLRRVGATRNWGYRLALELDAVTRATGTSGDRAAEAWAALMQAEREAGMATFEPPSFVERAESLRRRSSVLRAAGRAADAAVLEGSLREALKGQHAASPRWAWLTQPP
jgi:tetratricopeptide (TPR) repeat protein